jgi:hypothetical protein
MGTKCQIWTVRPEMVVEVSYLTWTEDGLLRQVVYLGEREDKPGAEVRKEPPKVRPWRTAHGQFVRSTVLLKGRPVTETYPTRHPLG